MDDSLPLFRVTCGCRSSSQLSLVFTWFQFIEGVSLAVPQLSLVRLTTSPALGHGIRIEMMTLRIPICLCLLPFDCWCQADEVSCTILSLWYSDIFNQLALARCSIIAINSFLVKLTWKQIELSVLCKVSRNISLGRPSNKGIHTNMEHFKGW